MAKRTGSRFSYYVLLWVKSVSLSWKGRVSLRGAFYFRIASIGFGYVVQFFTIWLLVSRFKTIGGWSAWEVGFLYSMHLLAYSLGASFFYYPAARLHTEILSGEFDTYMIRPVGPMTWFVAKNFATGYVMHIVVAVTILAMSWINLRLSWSFRDAMLFAMVIIGSAMIMGSMHILPSLISFWVPRSQNASELLFWTARQFIDYPIDIFARPIRFILIFAIPMAFVNYLPAHIFLGKALPPGYPDFLKYLSPAVGVVLIGVTVTCIRIAIRHYKSTGS